MECDAAALAAATAAAAAAAAADKGELVSGDTFPADNTDEEGDEPISVLLLLLLFDIVLASRALDCEETDEDDS